MNKDHPRHIAIIMDGNGRWAKKKLLNRISGHKKGIEAARTAVKTARSMGVEFLTLYTFSRENWLRPKEEVTALMGFLKVYLKAELPMLMEENIKLNVIGNLEELPMDVREVIKEVEGETQDNSSMILQLAISYSGRDDIAHSVKEIVSKIKSGELNSEDITEELIEENLYTAGVPDPDLLIRTSGESRLSNFMMWQLAYTEIYVSPVLWPDFTEDHLRDAVTDFMSRERRFGLTTDQVMKVTA